MNQPQYVTFTGVDDQTDLERLVSISNRYPVEWGVLIGGRKDKFRYPSLDRINQMSALASNTEKVFCSLHLCGIFAMQAKIGLTPSVVNMTGFSRVQVNSLDYDLKQLGELSKLIQKEVVFQHREGAFPDSLPMGVFPLHDQSGGRGVTPAQRPTQTNEFHRLVGYAGGIGPDSIVDVLNQIEAVHFWLDMESSLRTRDRFDLDRVESVLRSIYGAP